MTSTAVTPAVDAIRVRVARPPWPIALSLSAIGVVLTIVGQLLPWGALRNGLGVPGGLRVLLILALAAQMVLLALIEVNVRLRLGFGRVARRVLALVPLGIGVGALV